MPSIIRFVILLSSCSKISCCLFPIQMSKVSSLLAQHHAVTVGTMSIVIEPCLDAGSLKIAQSREDREGKVQG